MNSKRLYINFFIAILAVGSMFCSCNFKPRGVLSERQMRDVLIDLHRVDGVVQIKGLAATRDTLIYAYYDDVLKKHGITQAQFDSSLVWYTDNPNIFDKIYPSIIETLETEHTALILATQSDRERADMARQAQQRLDSTLRSSFQRVDLLIVNIEENDYDSLPLFFMPNVLDSLQSLSK